MSALPSPLDFDGAQLLCTAPPPRDRARLPDAKPKSGNSQP